MHDTPALETFWITFPQDQNLVFGIGVTAYSEEDAFALIKERGVDKWFENAHEIKISQRVRIEDLDQSNVAPNIGPLQLRGVWYACMNIGIGAPKGDQFKRLDDARNA